MSWRIRWQRRCVLFRCEFVNKWLMKKNCNQESALAAQEKDIADMKDELTYLRERNEQLSKGNATVDLELAELRASQERLEEDAKENAANLELAKDREAEMSNEIDRLKMQVQELQQVQAVAAADDREKRKADMLAEMMAKIDTVRAGLRIS